MDEHASKDRALPWMPSMEDALSSDAEDSSVSQSTPLLRQVQDAGNEPSLDASSSKSKITADSSQSQQAKSHSRRLEGIRRYEHDYDGQKIRTKRTAIFELIEGVTLYAICIFLPTIIGVVIKYYETYANSTSERQNSSSGGVTSPEGDLSSDYLLPGWFYDHCKHWYRRLMDIICNPNWSPVTSYCTQDSKGYWHGPISSYLASKASAAAAGVTLSAQLSDLQLMVILSSLLALLRIFLVHCLVPEVLEEKQLAAMLRCKSMHVLSRDSLNSFESPVIDRRKLETSVPPSGNGNDKQASGTEPKSSFGGAPTPPLAFPPQPLQAPQTPTRKPVSSPTKFAESSIQRRSSWSPATSEAMRRVGVSIIRSVGHEDASLVYDNAEELAPHEVDPRRLFRAPRYATAVFRLFFCSITTFYAWVLFQKAAFWPIYLGGTNGGLTKNCWDLSGNVHLTSLDSDFDHQNGHLRYYFIIQGSYHLQSLGFQVISLVVLLLTKPRSEEDSGLKPGARPSGKWVSMRKSMREYIRPLAEHMTAVFLILAAFLFSGLRRLGALTMYTMDLSGIFLQLLQVSLNAPNESKLADIRLIRCIHTYLAIPFFLYCRLFVLPFIIWYSVAVESTEWFRQIERVLVPGAGIILYLTFNSLLLVIQTMNILYLHRLLRHPQVQKLKKAKSLQNAPESPNEQQK